MDSDQPLVSIGMPLYNEETFLRKSLDSLLQQDYTNFELVISDNASTDSTQAICREYAARDQRIRYHCNETNQGASWNFNQVFRLSRSPYFMWAGGHDCWSPKLLSTCLRELEREPAAVLCYSRSCAIDPDGREIERKAPYVDTRHMGVVRRFNLVLWWLINPQAIYGLIRASALRETRLGQRVISADFVLLSELSLLGPFVHVPETLFHPREKAGEGQYMTERAHVQRTLAMMYPKGAGMRRHYCHLHYAYHTARGVLHAQVGLAMKPVLIGSVVLAYLGRLYKHLPSIIRRPIRNLFRAKWGITEGRG
jgi:hypothetical protein